MHADKIVGRVGATILKNRVAEMGPGAQDTAARFRLDRLSSAQIASVVREVVSDPILTVQVDVKIPDSLVLGETMPEGCQTACKTFQISGVISVQKLPPWVV